MAVSALLGSLTRRSWPRRHQYRAIDLVLGPGKDGMTMQPKG